jgi:hypothetical protein
MNFEKTHTFRTEKEWHMGLGYEGKNVLVGMDGSPKVDEGKM